MRLCTLVILLVITLASPARAAISGQAYVHDGDTLFINGKSVRLWGIDAVELGQSCNGVPCGQMAKYQLVIIIAGREVVCEPRGRSYKRIVALCKINDIDIAAAMISAGMAFEARDYSDGYYESIEAIARSEGTGIWSLGAQSPALWRACQREGGCLTRVKFMSGFRPIRGRIAPFDAARRQRYAPRVKKSGISAVNAAVNAMPYRADTQRDQVLDADAFWRKGGDCDKFALVKMLELRAQGYRNMAFLVLKDGPGGEAHAVLVLPENGIMVALDNRFNKPVPVATLYKDYKPAYFIDADSGVVWHANGT